MLLQQNVPGPQSHQGWRPIIDFSLLNKMIQVMKFKMETPQQVITAINPGDWMSSIDLKDAYFQIPIHKRSRRYLRLAWDTIKYQFRAPMFWSMHSTPGVHQKDVKCRVPMSQTGHHTPLLTGQTRSRR